MQRQLQGQPGLYTKEEQDASTTWCSEKAHDISKSGGACLQVVPSRALFRLHAILY